MEVEGILNHRKRKNKYEYLVKWKDENKKINEWIKEDNFDTVEIIQKYWDRRNKKID